MVYLLGFIILWVLLVSFKKKYFENKYIERHKLMKKQIKDYENYLNFCEKENEIPLGRIDFEVNVLH